MIDVRLFAFVASCPADLIDNVARIAGSELLTHRSTDECDQIGRDIGVVGNGLIFRNPAEDLNELVIRDRANLDLGLNAAQKRRINQLGRIEVRREDDKHLKGNLDLLSTYERKKIDTAVERNDPAIEKLVRAHALAAKVID